MQSCGSGDREHTDVTINADTDLSKGLDLKALGELLKKTKDAKTLEEEVAVKIFKGDLTTDGYAKDEMQAYMSIAEHPNLINVKARIKGNNPLGLVLELVPKEYQNLGFPPDFDTCTRDTFAKNSSFAIETVYSIAKAMLSVSKHLHEKGMMHGDLYAHNILFNRPFAPQIQQLISNLL